MSIFCCGRKNPERESQEGPKEMSTWQKSASKCAEFVRDMTVFAVCGALVGALIGIVVTSPELLDALQLGRNSRALPHGSPAVHFLEAQIEFDYQVVSTYVDSMTALGAFGGCLIGGAAKKMGLCRNIAKL